MASYKEDKVKYEHEKLEISLNLSLLELDMLFCSIVEMFSAVEIGLHEIPPHPSAFKHLMDIIIQLHNKMHELEGEDPRDCKAHKGILMRLSQFN